MSQRPKIEWQSLADHSGLGSACRPSAVHSGVTPCYWESAWCFLNRNNSSGSSLSYRYGKFGWENAFRYGFLRFLMKDIGNHWEKAYAEKLRQERPASVLYETTAIYIFAKGRGSLHSLAC